ncbi:MAG: T9SS type A sorting domain-containing protein, partial [Bacteroidota bacterium]
TDADAQGNFTLSTVFPGEYALYVGAWGYQTVEIDIEVDDNGSFTVELEEGIRDEFALDLGWTVTGNASTGAWERGEPDGTSNQGQASNTDFDILTDLGDQCYVTGNGGGSAGNDDVDDGNTILTSPVFDLSNYADAKVTYNTWFYNAGGDGTPNDALIVRVSNGVESVELETIGGSSSAWRLPSSFQLEDVIEFTNNMTVSFETFDQANAGHLVEAAIDVFEVTGNQIVTNTNDLFDDQAAFTAAPNPFNEQIEVRYTLDANLEGPKNLQVINVLGQIVEAQELNEAEGVAELGAKLDNGIYFIRINVDGKMTEALRVVKQ